MAKYIDSLLPKPINQYLLLIKQIIILFRQHNLGYFFFTKMYPESTCYNNPAFFILKGNLNVERFISCIKNIINRHDSLRTIFITTTNGPVQKILENVDINIELCKKGEKNLNELAKHFVKPFDLKNAPLLKIGLYEIKEKEYFLLFDIHHIIADGFSIEIIIKELMSLYEGNILDNLDISYKDF